LKKLVDSTHFDTSSIALT